jgi:molybdopterin-binding protein
VDNIDADLVCVRIAPSITVWAVSGTPLTAGARVQLSYRPEDIALSLPSVGHQTSARNVFALQVETITPAGGLVRVGLGGGLKLAAIITRRSAEELELSPGTEVNAHVKAAAFHIFTVAT